MLVEQEARTVREAVGVFNRSEDLQGAIDELLSSGFDRAELSLLASEHAVEEKLGHRYEKVGALAEDTKAALRHDATPEELREAIWVAAEMRAGGAYAHSAVSLVAMDEAADRAPSS